MPVLIFRNSKLKAVFIVDSLAIKLVRAFLDNDGCGEYRSNIT